MNIKRNMQPGDDVQTIRHRQPKRYVGHVTGNRRGSSSFPNVVILAEIRHRDGTWSRLIAPEDRVRYISHRPGGKYVYEVEAGAPVWVIPGVDWDSFGFWVAY